MRRGQALVEVGVALPLLVVLAFGAFALARVATAQSGLDAATAAAAATAARQPDPTSAATAGAHAFAATAAGYPLDSAAVTISDPWIRGGTMTASGTATVTLGVPLPGLPDRLALRSRAGALIEPYRSRQNP